MATISRSKYPGWRHMTSAERYNAKLHALFDDARRRGAWDHLDTDDGPDGARQCVLPGAERATDAVLAQRRANAPLKPKTAQRPCDAGLFSDEADQLDLCEMFQDGDLGE